VSWWRSWLRRISSLQGCCGSGGDLLLSLVECVTDLGFTGRKPSPTLLSVVMVTALLSVTFPAGGTIAEFPPLQHRALGVKTLPSLGERRRRHWRRALVGGVVSCGPHRLVTVAMVEMRLFSIGGSVLRIHGCWLSWAGVKVAVVSSVSAGRR
jgi:hypothetical protein